MAVKQVSAQLFRLLRSDQYLLSRAQIARYRSEGLIIPAFRLPESALVRLEFALSAVLPDIAADTPDYVGHLHSNPGLAASMETLGRTPLAPAGEDAAGRLAKAFSCRTSVYADGELVPETAYVLNASERPD